MWDWIAARVVHVLAVVVWIGGVAMVTTVLLPAVRRIRTPQERVQFFEEVESGFARQARWTTLLAGVSGFYLVYELDAGERFLQPAFWWMHAMVLVWAMFTLMLFVLEPLWLHRWLRAYAKRDPERAFLVIQRLHWCLLTLSLITVAAAVAGAHGWLH